MRSRFVCERHGWQRLVASEFPLGDPQAACAAICLSNFFGRMPTTRHPYADANTANGLVTLSDSVHITPLPQIPRRWFQPTAQRGEQ